VEIFARDGFILILLNTILFHDDLSHMISILAFYLDFDELKHLFKVLFLQSLKVM
jgi:hypothetical protein